MYSIKLRELEALRVEDGGGGGCDIEWRVMVMLDMEVRCRQINQIKGSRHHPGLH